MGKLLAIARHAQPRAPMELLSSVAIAIDSGLDGDARGVREGSNVVVVHEAGWRDACEQLGKEPPWTTRRGNLLVDGESLYGTAGKYLQVGGVVLKINGECQPCQVMDAQVPGLRSALNHEWRAGVECTVIRAGQVSVGDIVTVTVDP